MWNNQIPSFLPWGSLCFLHSVTTVILEIDYQMNVLPSQIILWKRGSNMNKLQDIIEEIQRLQKELLLEIQKKEDEFFYKIKGKKVCFEAETRKYHKALATKIHTYLFNVSFLNILTTPIIWFCIIPAVFMDLVISIYQLTCFKVYYIPKVKRSDYILIDRHSLSYLNPIEKFNYVYCWYFNGLIAYVQEIAARTEQYWCPIKHARKLGSIHNRYHKFLEYGDCEEYQKKLEEIRRDFSDLSGSKECGARIANSNRKFLATGKEIYDEFQLWENITRFF